MTCSCSCQNSWFYFSMISTADFLRPFRCLKSIKRSLSVTSYRSMSLAKYFGRPYKDWFEVTKPIHPKLAQTGCFLKLFRWKECKIPYFGWLNSCPWEASIQKQYRHTSSFNSVRRIHTEHLFLSWSLFTSPFPLPPKIHDKGELFIPIHSRAYWKTIFLEIHFAPG